MNPFRKVMKRLWWQSMRQAAIWRSRKPEPYAGEMAAFHLNQAAKCRRDLMENTK